MRISTTILALLAPFTVDGRREPVDEMPQRDADDSIACTISNNGTAFGTTSGPSVEETYRFQMEYNATFNQTDLFSDMNNVLGSIIMAAVFPNCQEESTRKLVDLDDIAGLDATPNYNFQGECLAGDTIFECGIFTGGLKVFLSSDERKLTDEDVGGTILSVVKDAMDSGLIAEEVEGINSVAWGDDAASDGGVPDYKEPEPVKESEEFPVFGWVIIAVSSFLVAGIGFAFQRRRTRDLDDEAATEHNHNSNLNMYLERNNEELSYIEDVEDDKTSTDDEKPQSVNCFCTDFPC